MIIKLSYESLTSLVDLMRSVTATKNLQEDMKVINFFVKDNKLCALGTDGQLYCLDEVEGNYDLEGETNPYMVVRIKELFDILSKYSSLQRTVVKEITLATQPKCVLMSIEEASKDIKDGSYDFTDMFKNQVVKYKLNRSDVRALVTRELPSMVLPDNYVEIESKKLQKYLEYMHAPMAKPRDISIMHFDPEFVYSIMGNVYGVAMPNHLPPEIFSGLSIPLQYVTFLKNLIPKHDKFKIYKNVEVKKLSETEGDEDWNIRRFVTLYIESGTTLVKLKVADNTNSASTKSFKQKFDNIIVVDKLYFIDMLKRYEGFDQVFLEITITPNASIQGSSDASFVIKTATNKQTIPVKSAQGSGEFKFMLRPESLGLMAFTHLTKDLDGKSDKIVDLIFCLDNSEKGVVSLSCRDRSDDWETRYPKAPCKEAPKLDF